MTAVNFCGSAPISQFFEKDAWKNSYIGKVGNAVAAFFAWIVQTIANAIKSGWNSLASTPVPPIAGPLGDPYGNMPLNGVDFVEKSIELFKQTLHKKDPRLLQKFNEEWAIVSNVVEIWSLD